MDEALILKKLDDLSNEVRTLKAEVVEELKHELQPAKSSSSLIEECLAESEDTHAKEDLTFLVRNLIDNVETLNSLLRTVKGAMELKEEIEPIAKIAYPMAIETAAEVTEGLDTDQIKPLIRNTLANLENFNTALNMLKAGMELKDEIEPIAKLAYPMAIETLTEVSENLDMEQVKPLVRNTLANLENFNTALNMLKAGMELKDEIEPIAKLAYPMAIETLTEVSENLDMEQVKPLVRNTLANLENFNTALTMLKAGMELKDDIEPIAKLAYPMAIETLTEVSENLDMEQVKPLIRNSLANLENFNAALGMFKAGMELKDDIEPLAKLSLPEIIDFFTSISGLMQISGSALTAVKEMQISPEQAEAMGKVIHNIDLSKTEKVTMFGMMKKLNDPKIQQGLGAAFAMLEAFGSLLLAYKEADRG